MNCPAREQPPQEKEAKMIERELKKAIKHETTRETDSQSDSKRNSIHFFFILFTFYFKSRKKWQKSIRRWKSRSNCSQSQKKTEKQKTMRKEVA